jgi:multidrug efflux pump subunit AcrA (membrane-fusion protein)
MIRKLALPLIAVGMFSFMSFHLLRSSQTLPAQAPFSEPARSPFTHVIAGAGILEARTENIKVGSPTPGVVALVAVKVGMKVKAGDLLFRLDDRQMSAELKVREAQLAAARSSLDKLEAMPRPEEVPASEAKVRRAQAQMLSERDLLERREKLVKNLVGPEEEVIHHLQSLTSFHDALRQSKAEEELLKAGGWKVDKAVARAEVLRAQSVVDQFRTELERLEVRAPVTGHVLKVDVRRGEYVGTPPGQPLIVLGDLDHMHVRIDIDEQDIPRFRPGNAGKAFVRGDGSRGLPLSFVRVEPYVQPKLSLTGGPGERVDTRVLQVIYALEPGVENVYVGQQVDAFVEITDTGAIAAGSKQTPKQPTAGIAKNSK